MKKILTVSLVAMMAVSAARADIASKAYVDSKDGDLTTLQTTAKNNLVAAINEVRGTANAGQTEQQVATAIATALEDYTETGQDASYATAAQGAKADTALQPADVTATGSNGVTASASDGAITVAGVAATTSAAGVVQLADAAAVTDGTVGRVVDAAQLKSVADTASGALDNYYTKAEAATAAQGAKADTALQPADVTASGSNGVNASATDGAITVTGVAATTSAAGVVQLADAAAVTDGTVGRVVDAAQLKAVSDSVSALDSTYATDTELTDGLALKQDKLGNTNVTTNGSGNVVTGVSASDGAVTVSTGNAIMSGLPTLTAGQGDGTYTLTMSKSGDVETYKWEMIQR